MHCALRADVFEWITNTQLHTAPPVLAIEVMVTSYKPCTNVNELHALRADVVSESRKLNCTQLPLY